MALGLDVIWLTHVQAHLEAKGWQVLPVFSDALYDRYRQAQRAGLWGRARRLLSSVARPAQAPPPWRRQADELRAAFDRLDLGPSDHVLFHTADGTLYAAIDALLRESRLEGCPRLHVCTPYDPQGVMPNRVPDKPVESVVRGWVEEGWVPAGVRLYGENPRLAEHLSHCFGAEVAALPLIAIEPGEAAGAPWPGTGDGVRIVYLGPARTEKGFHLLPDIVRRTREFVGDPRAVDFVIQCPPQIIGYNDVVLRAIERLRAMAPAVTLLDEYLDDAAYLGLLHGADVALMPYGVDEYRYRSSGIVTEALSLGCILAARSGTYPASMIAPGAGVLGDAPIDIGRELARVVANIDAFRAAAAQSGRRYRSENGPVEYVTRCIGAG